MYDDIAHNKENSKRGIIINKPKGDDVYAGVPKDYTGEHVNAGNFYAVLLGNKSALTGGSRKVVDSGPDDHIFVYYTDHGGLGSLGMPSGRSVYADELTAVLKKNHASGCFKNLVSLSVRRQCCTTKCHRCSILKLVNQGVFLKVFFRKIYTYIQPRQLMLWRIALQLTAMYMDTILVLGIYTAFPGWRIGQEKSIAQE